MRKRFRSVLAFVLWDLPLGIWEDWRSYRVGRKR